MRAGYDFTQARRNPFTCTHCGALATSRHYDETTSEWQLSLCETHTPWLGWPDNIATPDDCSMAESVKKRGKVSASPTESGEFRDSKAPVA